MVRVHWCLEADKEHEEAQRQYAHTGHYGGIVCVANAYFDLPPRIRVGILLHEFAHVAGAEGEREADRLAKVLFGIEIRRVDTEYGEDLEMI